MIHDRKTSEERKLDVEARSAWSLAGPLFVWAADLPKEQRMPATAALAFACRLLEAIEKIARHADEVAGIHDLVKENMDRIDRSLADIARDMPT